MGIVAKPDEQLIPITLYYVEEQKEQGHSVFNFIETKEEFSEWKEKGYLTAEDIDEIKTRAAKEPDYTAPPFDEQKTIGKVKTLWRRMTWKDQNTIYSQCIRENIDSQGKVNAKFDAIMFRDMKLKTCLKSWDVKDENTKDQIPITAALIDDLDPEVAQELLSSFEQVTEPSDKE